MIIIGIMDQDDCVNVAEAVRSVLEQAISIRVQEYSLFDLKPLDATVQTGTRDLSLSGERRL